MAVPARPVFQNGQRLTAERLNAALEFLRGSLRRLSLGPLSAGVAAGLALGPRSPQTGAQISVGAGVGIDGRGRLMVLEFPASFTVADIEAQIGGQLRTGDFVEIRLVLTEDAGATSNECLPAQEIAVLQNAQLVLARSASIASLPQIPPTGCVNPWEDLDRPLSGADCGITLGHVTRNSVGQLQALTDLRQGVSALLGRIRNANGTQALSLADGTTTETGEHAEMVRALLPLVSDARLVANAGANFHGTADFDQLIGGEVQATHIGAHGARRAEQVAGVYAADPRVFVVAGGTGASTGPTSVASQLGGLAAVQIRVHHSFGQSLIRPGVPLIADVDTGGVAAVRELFAGADRTRLVGLSAAAAQSDAASGAKVVPVATAGLMQVTLAGGAGAFGVGAALTADPTDPLRLRPTTNNTNILARAAQASTGSSTEILAWVVHAPQNLTPA